MAERERAHHRAGRHRPEPGDRRRLLPRAGQSTALLRRAGLRHPHPIDGTRPRLHPGRPPGDRLPAARLHLPAAAGLPGQRRQHPGDAPGRRAGADRLGVVRLPAGPPGALAGHRRACGLRGGLLPAADLHGHHAVPAGAGALPAVADDRDRHARAAGRRRVRPSQAVDGGAVRAGRRAAHAHRADVRPDRRRPHPVADVAPVGDETTSRVAHRGRVHRRYRGTAGGMVGAQRRAAARLRTCVHQSGRQPAAGQQSTRDSRFRHEHRHRQL